MKTLSVDRSASPQSATLQRSILETKSGEYLRAIGAADRYRKLPPSHAAIYRNDFFLTDPAPWQEAELVTDPPRTGDEPLVIRWEDPETEKLKSEFDRIESEIERGRIEKVVPVLTEHGSIVAGNPASIMGASHEKERGRFFYFEEGKRGMAGVTPERLFRIEGGRLETAALAGTARRDDGDRLLESEKELSEHRCVADFIEASLEPYGKVERGREALQPVGDIVHLTTPISVELHEGFDWGANINDLIRVLHPTPAVGIAPRTEKTLGELAALRERLGTPDWFACPVGFRREDRCEIFVAIRCLLWEGERVLLPSGAGMVKGSRFDREIAELKLKRDSVKETLGIA